MELYDIVMKLVGPVDPVGETRADEQRLENLKKLTALTDALLCEIYSVAHNADRNESSMKAIGVRARNFMEAVRNA